MMTGRKAGDAECILCAQLLPMTTVVTYQSVSITLAVAGEKINTPDGDRYFIITPCCNDILLREQEFLLIACCKAFNKKMRRVASLKHNARIKLHEGIGKPDEQFVQGAIIKKFSAVENRQIGKPIF